MSDRQPSDGRLALPRSHLDRTLELFPAELRPRLHAWVDQQVLETDHQHGAELGSRRAWFVAEYGVLLLSYLAPHRQELGSPHVRESAMRDAEKHALEFLQGVLASVAGERAAEEAQRSRELRAEDRRQTCACGHRHHAHGEDEGSCAVCGAPRDAATHREGSEGVDSHAYLAISCRGWECRCVRYRPVSAIDHYYRRLEAMQELPSELELYGIGDDEGE